MVERPEGEVGTGLGTGSRLAHHVDTLLASFDRLSFASVAPGMICVSDAENISAVPHTEVQMVQHSPP